VVAVVASLLLIGMGGAVSGCSADHSAPTTAGGPGAAAGPSHTPDSHAPAGAGVPTGQEAAAMWDARPAFVSDAPHRTQTAYAFAISRPDVVRWLPCYCGSGAMGHLSNLDCFIKPTEGFPVVYEEHGSYCDVCVDIAHMAQDMLNRGKSLIQIRAAVDSEFGGLAPGTPTELPPA
jgi:hypothetical protein